MAAATTCNNCMGLYSVNALQQCLQTGLSTGAYIGIGVACAVVVIAVIVIIVMVVKSNKQAKAKHELHLDNIELDNVNLETIANRYRV